jgi:raffinose/stachyose/melibiose transport system permease protein
MYLICGGVALGTLAPLVWVTISSFKKNSEFLGSPWKLPDEWMFSNYIDAWKSANLGIHMLNSLFYTVTSVVVVIIICAMAAYAIERLKIRWGKALYIYLILGIMIPMPSLIVPLYLLFSDLNLLDSRLGIIIVYVTFHIPITIALFCAFMKGIPGELEEAALMDGAGVVRIFYSIILPLCSPAIATATILNFLSFWNEFIFAMMFTTSQKLRPLSVALASFKGEYQTDYSSLAAAMIIAIIPILFVFIFMQEKVVSGVTGGAVKG